MRRRTRMEVLTFAVVLVVLVAALVGLRTWWRTPDRRLHAMLRRVPCWPIGELAAGRSGRIVGTARAAHADAVLAAPLSGRPCVAYRVTVWKVLAQQRPSDRLVAVRGGVPFVVEDASGRALIDPEGAVLLLENDRTSRSGPLDRPTPAERAFLDQHYPGADGALLCSALLCYEEAIIGIGERVMVVGVVIREADPDAALPPSDRGVSRTRVRFERRTDKPVIVCAAPPSRDAA